MSFIMTCLLVSLSLLLCFNGAVSTPIIPSGGGGGNFVGTEIVTTPDQPKQTYGGSGESGVSQQDICIIPDPLYYETSVFENIESKLSSIKNPLNHVWGTVWNSSDIYLNTVLNSGITKPTNPSILKTDSCAELYTALSNVVPLMECYFDALTVVLGNLTAEVTHKYPSAWAGIRELVYDAYHNSSVVDDIKKLKSGFSSSCPALTTSYNCSANLEAVEGGLNEVCSEPYCLPKKIEKYALITIPIYTSVNRIQSTMVVIKNHIQLCSGGEDNDNRRRRG